MQPYEIYHYIYIYISRSQKNGAVSKGNKKSISHLTRVKRTQSAAATVQVSRALPTVRFSCLLRGRGATKWNIQGQEIFLVLISVRG
jgi:hypothetical protein